MALTRRGLVTAALPAVGAGAALLRGTSARGAEGAQAAQHAGHAHDSGHAAFRGGRVDPARNGFDPHLLLRDFDRGTTSTLPDGRTLREWTLVAKQKDIEIAPGVIYTAWTYNGRVPGPTLRATEGDVLRITFINGTEHDHTIHFHGIHPASMDGVPGLGDGTIGPGRQTAYEFEATPYGLHLYHCHVRPLAEHIAKGLYGALIIDPRQARDDADELVLVMNGFDTNFDRANEVYAANTVGFAYMDPPIQVRRDALVRIYIVNVLEFDLINSFHLHGNLFDWYPTGTRREPSEYTDTVMMCQGQRGIAELRFPHFGRYMFHAHQSEFTELGWQGFIEVCDERDGALYCPLTPAGTPR